MDSVVRLVGLGLVVLAGCSQVAGIGGEFQVADDAGAGSDDALLDDAPVTGFRQLAYLKASNPGPGDTFGSFVAMSADGSTIAVGAPYEDSSSRGINGTQNDELGIDSGAVYVFAKSGDTWIQQAYLKASNSDDEDHFGYSLGLSDNGNTLIVGAQWEDSSSTGVDGASGGNSAMDAGAAYIFERSGATWTQAHYLKASNTQMGDQFGWNVAISGDGNTAAVTAIFEDSAANTINGNQADNTAGTAGAVYVFTRGSTWTQQAYIKASNNAAQTYFGRGLGLSQDGNTLVATAPNENSAATGINGTQTGTGKPNSGAAYVFVRSGTAWSQQAYIKALNSEADDNFGWCADISSDGNVIIIGAPNEDSASTGINGSHTSNAALSAGAAYVFTRSGTTWMQESYVKPTNTSEGDQFGLRVAIAADGQTFTVGTQHEDGGGGLDGNQNDDTLVSSGAAYVYTRSTQTLLHYLKAGNRAADDHFGYLGAGTVFVVGAPDEDSGSSGINGDPANNSVTSAGAVYVFGE